MNKMTRPHSIPDPLATLQAKFGIEWKAINKARKSAEATSHQLRKLLNGLSSADASIVVFGSLARREWNSKSDVDWTLLIDGQADPEHFTVARKITSSLKTQSSMTRAPQGHSEA
jgi:predicted nucleotidyltransferase